MSATYAQFLSDPLRVSVWLAEISYNDPTDDTAGVLYYSTDSYGTSASDTPASQLYSPRLMNGYDFSSVAPAIGPFGGLLPAREGGALVLAQNLGDLDGHRLLSFDGQSVIVRHGGWSPVYGWVAYSDFAVVFNGEVQGAALVGIDTVTIQLRNRDARLEFPIQDRRYTGGTYWLYFDGAGDRVACGAAAAATSHLNFTTGDFTVEFYTYLETAPASNLFICGRGLAATDGWFVRMNTGGYVALVTCQAGVSQTTISSAITLNKRVHVAVVRSGATCTIYFDGVDVTATPGTHTDPLTAARIFYLGCNDVLGNVYAGYLDEFRIWNSARTKGVINSLKDRQLQATEMTGLLFYAKCDDGTGTALTDSSTYAVACTITGATWHPSLQGGEDLEGMPLPDVWGQRHGWVPVLVDEPRLIYQVHSGSVYETTQVLVGGVPISYDPSPGTTYTSMSAFLNATTAPACYERLVTQYGTWIRLKSAPNMPVTMTVKGDNTGGTGYGDASTYRSSVSEIVRYIVCNRGPQPLVDPSDLDTDSFDDLEAANSCVVGDGYADDRTIVDVINYLLSSIGAVGWFDRTTGDFTVYRFDGAEAGYTSKGELLALSEKDVAEGTLEVLDTGAPAWGIDLYWKKNDLVHSSTDIAASVISASPPPITNWRFLMLDWRKTAPRDASVRTSYKGAVIHELQTAIQNYADAAAEAARLLALYSTQGQCFRAFFKERATQLDRMDFVSFSFQDLDKYGELQQRLGTSAASAFIVLAVEDEVENGGTWLTLYREAVT